MDNDTKKQIKQRYERELNKGELFWPDSIFKDVIVWLGSVRPAGPARHLHRRGGEPKADPSDTSYVPRPEWYFLFLFKFLALYGQIPVIGKIEWLATVLIPSIGIGLILLLPFIERSKDRYYAKRAMPIGIMVVMVVDIVILTLISNITTVAAEDATLTEKFSALLQPYAGLVIPAIVVATLVILAYVFKNTSWKLMAWVTGIGSVLMIVLTVLHHGRSHPSSRPRRRLWQKPWRTRSWRGRTCTRSTAWNATAMTAR